MAYFLPTFGTVVDNDNQFRLVRAIYTPDELNLTTYVAGEKKNMILGVDLCETHKSGHKSGTSQGTR